jgi:hypothetical protein
MDFELGFRDRGSKEAAMSGEAQDAKALHDAALASYPALRDAAAAVGHAKIALGKAANGGNIVTAIQAADSYALAAELLAELANATKAQADAAIKAAMELGATQVQCDGHKLVLCQNAPKPVIHDRSAVPEECLAPQQPAPPRKPDMAKVREYLQNHPESNWGELLNGVISLQRRRDL